MLEMAQPNQLQPPRTGSEFIVPVPIVEIAVELRDRRSPAGFASHEIAPIADVGWRPIGIVTEGHIADRGARAVVGKLGLQVRILGLGMINFVPPFGQHMICVIDADRTTEAASSRVVFGRQGIVYWSRLPGVAY